MGLAERTSPEPAVRVLVLNPHATEREGLAAVLAREADLDVVGATGNLEDALALIDQMRPDVVVMELAALSAGGIDQVRRVLGDGRATRVVAVRREYTRELVAAAFEAGASACVSTDASVADLVNAVHAARNGRNYLCPYVTRVLIEAPVIPAVTVPPGGRQLTRREQEVLELIAAGNTDRQIASHLRLAVGTVHTHRKHIMAKLGVRNVTSLLRRTRELGLLPAS